MCLLRQIDLQYCKFQGFLLSFRAITFWVILVQIQAEPRPKAKAKAQDPAYDYGDYAYPDYGEYGEYGEGDYESYGKLLCL